MSVNYYKKYLKYKNKYFNLMNKQVGGKNLPIFLKAEMTPCPKNARKFDEISTVEGLAWKHLDSSDEKIFLEKIKKEDIDTELEYYFERNERVLCNKKAKEAQAISDSVFNCVKKIWTDNPGIVFDNKRLIQNCEKEEADATTAALAADATTAALAADATTAADTRKQQRIKLKEKKKIHNKATKVRRCIETAALLENKENSNIKPNKEELTRKCRLEQVCAANFGEDCKHSDKNFDEDKWKNLFEKWNNDERDDALATMEYTKFYKEIIEEINKEAIKAKEDADAKAAPEAAEKAAADKAAADKAVADKAAADKAAADKAAEAEKAAAEKAAEEARKAAAEAAARVKAEEAARVKAEEEARKTAAVATDATTTNTTAKTNTTDTTDTTNTTTPAAPAENEAVVIIKS